MHWAIQTNLGRDEYVDKLIEYAGKKHKVSTYEVIPFSDDLPNVPVLPNTMFYGSTGTMTKVHKSKIWDPGVCAISDRWIDEFGEESLNSDYTILPLGHLDSVDLPEEFFIRPTLDGKLFSGQIMRREEVRKWVTDLKGQYAIPVLQEHVMFSSCKNIYSEYRTFVVNGKYVTGSRYKSDGFVRPHYLVPDDVIEFVNHTTKVYKPHNLIYTLDIAVIQPYELKVIEVNGFNSSGFYHSDIEKIVYEVGKCLEG